MLSFFSRSIRSAEKREHSQRSVSYPINFLYTAAFYGGSGLLWAFTMRRFVEENKEDPHFFATSMFSDVPKINGGTRTPLCFHSMNGRC